MRTVELVVDPGLDDLVRAVWRRLHAAGLPSLATHTHPTNRPHLTLAAAQRLTPEVGAALAGLPVPAELDRVVCFERTVVWRVVLTDALRELHAEVWRALGDTARNPLHAPGSWVPHVSLALRAKDVARYEAELRDLPAARGSFVRARTYDSQTRTVADFTD
jgi:hypothetical protein